MNFLMAAIGHHRSVFSKPMAFGELGVGQDDLVFRQAVPVRGHRQIDFVHWLRTCSAMGGGGQPWICDEKQNENETELVFVKKCCIGMHCNRENKQETVALNPAVKDIYVFDRGHRS
jgi:hypothetical protein